jgi:hypothetical protein
MWACGTGHNIPIITSLPAVKRYMGVDVPDYALNQARFLLRVDFHNLDIEMEALPDHSDLVFGSLLMEYLLDDI